MMTTVMSTFTVHDVVNLNAQSVLVCVITKKKDVADSLGDVFWQLCFLHPGHHLPPETSVAQKSVHHA